MSALRLAACCAPLLLLAPADDELRVVHREGTVVSVSEESSLSMDFERVTVEVDGQELPPELVARMGLEFDSKLTEKRLRSTTYVDAVEDGRPVRGRRHFDELWQKETSEGAGADEEQETWGVLDGRTIELRAGEDDEVTARLAEDDDGDAVDESFLERHRLRFDMERYLPEEPVEPGDRWELDEATARAILGSGEQRGPRLFEDEDEEGGFGELLRDEAELSGEVSYQEVAEHEGLRCALLVVELTAELDEAPLDSAFFGDDEDGGEAQLSGTMTLRVSGTERLWFALDEGHPVSSEAEIGGEMVMRIEVEGEAEVVITATAILDGSWENTTSVTRGE